jgi:hypothetical protein
MNKKIVVFVLCGAILLLGFWKGYPFFRFPQEIKKDSIIASQKEIPLVTLTFDDGKDVATYTGIPASTAFTALQYFLKEKNITLQTKQYDFGVFIEQIGDKANTKDFAWIYSVNGKSGEMASDTYMLHSGDNVLWQYTKPIF